MGDYSYLTIELSVAISKATFKGAIVAYPGELSQCEIQLEIKPRTKEVRTTLNFQVDVGKLTKAIQAWLKSILGADEFPSVRVINSTTFRLPVSALPEKWKKDKIANVGTPTTSALFAIVCAAQDGIRSTLTQQKILGVMYAIQQEVIPL
jgi:hypothetical protein